MNVLRKLVFTFLICFLVKIAFSQQRYYIYIQSEDKQEFYARTGSGIFNSSGNGYLVIPGLEKNTHEIIIGFPGKNDPEWRFNCTISDADLGFVLEAGSNYGMQLLNLGHKEGVKGTLVEHHSKIKDNNVVATSGAISNDPFSSMLAEVVNDPTIRRQLVIVEKKNPAAVAAMDPPKAVQPEVPGAQKPADQEKNNITSAAPPSATPAKAGSDTAETADQSPAAFVVKEVQKTNSVQSGRSSRAGAAEKAGNTMAAVTEKKYEPFVVREIHEPANAQATQTPVSAAKKEDSVRAALPKEPEPFVLKETVPNDISQNARIKAGTEKTAVNNDEKYLPFVIKPGDDNKNNSEVKAAGPAAGEKIIAAETVPAGNDVPLVVTKENKATGMEKEKSNKPDPGKKDGSPAKASAGEKQAPAGKKTILSSVRKTLERKSREGTDLIYVDENINGAKDTIRIFIPVVQ